MPQSNIACSCTTITNNKLRQKAVSVKCFAAFHLSLLACLAEPVRELQKCGWLRINKRRANGFVTLV